MSVLWGVGVQVVIIGCAIDDDTGWFGEFCVCPKECMSKVVYFVHSGVLSSECLGCHGSGFQGAGVVYLLPRDCLESAFVGV